MLKTFLFCLYFCRASTAHTNNPGIFFRSSTLSLSSATSASVDSLINLEKRSKASKYYVRYKTLRKAYNAWALNTQVSGSKSSLYLYYEHLFQKKDFDLLITEMSKIDRVLQTSATIKLLRDMHIKSGCSKHQCKKWPERIRRRDQNLQRHTRTSIIQHSPFYQNREFVRIEAMYKNPSNRSAQEYEILCNVYQIWCSYPESYLDEIATILDHMLPSKQQALSISQLYTEAQNGSKAEEWQNIAISSAREKITLEGGSAYIDGTYMTKSRQKTSWYLEYARLFIHQDFEQILEKMTKIDQILETQETIETLRYIHKQLRTSQYNPTEWDEKIANRQAKIKAIEEIQAKNMAKSLEDGPDPEAVHSLQCLAGWRRESFAILPAEPEPKEESESESDSSVEDEC